MAVRLAMQHYPFRRPVAFVEVDEVTTVIVAPGYFDTRWTIPTNQIVVAEQPPYDPHDDTDDDDMVLKDPVRVPYLFTTTSLVGPTTTLLFTTRQRVPPLRLTATTFRDARLPFTRRESRSTGGVWVDGVALRMSEPTATVAAFLAAGVESTGDINRWLLHNRPVVTESEAVKRSGFVASLLGWVALVGGVVALGCVFAVRAGVADGSSVFAIRVVSSVIAAGASILARSRRP